MNEEEIKNRMMQQKMQEQMQQQYSAQAQQQQLEAALKIITSQIMEPKARERLNNLKFVKPDIAMQLEMYLAQLYQAGQLKTKLTDAQLITILQKLNTKPETKITRK